MSTYYISELNIYPVKSLRGIAVDSAEITARGFKNDRRWMLIDAESTFITQRKFAQLSLVDVELLPSGIKLIAPGMESITLPLTIQEGEMVSVQIWNDTCNALLGAKLFNEWFSHYLATDTRLVYMPETTIRKVDENYHVSNSDIVSFADGFPFLLISESSLQDLNLRLIAKNETQLSMKRFRPNIVVSGCDPYEEDTWKKFRVGGLTFYGVKPCSRCIVTTIDYEKGTRAKEPLATLKEYREKNNKVYFGMNVIHKIESGTGLILKKNQAIEVLET